ncbi:beta-propeller fold lactonase family protein [Sphingomonas sp. CL5.1]|uniref:lactonase family protein n=1 Tax=Sphingomonas sp. CL5.1 TaxID=2653203 RepID=UPI0015837813|nr:beta-propeller fold lactonase family protein [Sphingomonas sp. CL5.1]QKS00560.1 beta-propeller fold lactonase family protein [Sphingomonas sp. CL5.1]
MTDAGTRTVIDRLYVVAQSGGIAGFDLFDDGAMRSLPGSPFPTGAGTFNIIASPDRRFVYVAPGLGLGTPVSWHQSSSPQLATFRVEEDGTLTPAGAPLALPRSITPVTMAISRDGRDLYLGMGRGPAGFFFGRIAHFRIDDQGLPVPQKAPVSLGRRLDGAAQPIISPDGKSLYVASVLAKAVIRLEIRPDGSLSKPVERRISSGVFPITPGISPDGRYLYVANEQSKSIAGFRIGADGSLSELAGSPYPTGKIPHNPVFSADGRFVYFANTFSDSITGYEIQANGDLVPVPGSPFVTLPGPAALARSTGGEWLYLVSSPVFRQGSKVVVSAFRIQEDGSLLRTEHQPGATGLSFADGPSVIVLPA